MKKRVRICLMILNLLLLMVSLVCVWQTSRNVKYINSLEPILYKPDLSSFETECQSLSIYLPSGSALNTKFSKSGVRVVQSYRCQSLRDCYYIIFALQHQAKQNGYVFCQSTTELYGELRLHQIMYRIGYKTDQTSDADLEYTGDHRWYVRVASRIIGSSGY